MSLGMILCARHKNNFSMIINFRFLRRNQKVISQTEPLAVIIIDHGYHRIYTLDLGI